MNSKNLLLTILPLSLIASLFVGCAEAPVGSKERPFTMLFVPSNEAQTISTNAAVLAKFVEKEVSQKLLGKESGFYVKSVVPTSYIAVVEAMGNGKADFAGLSSFSYVLAKDIKKYDVEALLKVVRDNTLFYKAQFIVHADSKIKSLDDLNGKKMAYTDPSSTAGYIYPAQLLSDKGIKLGEFVFAQKFDSVVSMVYNKQVDVGVTYYLDPITIEEKGKKVVRIRDARERVLTQYPDVADKVKIIGFSKDIPNAPWCIRHNIFKDEAKNQALKTAVRDSLLAFAQSEEGKKALYDIQQVGGLIPITDDDYTDMRKTLMAANLDLEKLSQPANKNKPK